MSKINDYIVWAEDNQYIEYEEGVGYVSNVPSMADTMSFASEYMKTKQYEEEHIKYLHDNIL